MRYKKGDKVVLRTDLIDRADYGYYSYCKERYLPGSTQEITKVCSRDYELINGAAFLTDEMIDHEATTKLKDSNIFRWDYNTTTVTKEWVDENTIKEGEYYYVYDRTSGDWTISLAKSDGLCSRSAGHMVKSVWISENCFEKTPIAYLYKDEIWHRKATQDEIDWLDKCIEADKFMSQEEASNWIPPEPTVKKLIEFPSSGWCNAYNKEVLDYIVDNILTPSPFGSTNSHKFKHSFIRKHKTGFAWRKNSLWEVKSKSSLPEYSPYELLEVIPRSVATGNHSVVMGQTNVVASGEHAVVPMDWNLLNNPADNVISVDSGVTHITDPSITNYNSHNGIGWTDGTTIVKVKDNGVMKHPEPVIFKNKKKKSKLIIA